MGSFEQMSTLSFDLKNVKPMSLLPLNTSSPITSALWTPLL